MDWKGGTYDLKRNLLLQLHTSYRRTDRREVSPSEIIL